MNKIYKQVTQKREVTGVIADLIHFARECFWSMNEQQFKDDDLMVSKAEAYWDKIHGED